jgi:hypothetical protein
MSENDPLARARAQFTRSLEPVWLPPRPVELRRLSPEEWGRGAPVVPSWVVTFTAGDAVRSGRERLGE